MLRAAILFLLVTRLKASGQSDEVCSGDQYTCRDGSCIPLAHKCNGVVNCPDRSDEAHVSCWNQECESNQFRCTYGACVNGTAPCNTIPECADFSDELVPECRKEQRQEGNYFKCFDGSSILASCRCNGKRDCADGSDESLWTCIGSVCPSHQFQCAYGACVDMKDACNGVKDCDDESDEATEVCKYFRSFVDLDNLTNPRSFKKCTFPPQPRNGRFKPLWTDDSSSQVPSSSLYLEIICDPGYHLKGSLIYVCLDGESTGPMPECLPHCNELKTGPLSCNVQTEGVDAQEMSCVVPDHAFSLDNRMKPTENNTNADLSSCGDAGFPTSGFIAGGRSAVKQELPWHAGIYTKTSQPYRQICGGSLVKENVVISAAHCFWGDVEKQKPAQEYAVAVGKLYRPWNDKHDEDAQKSDVADIKIPPRYQGSDTSLQDDIAIVIVSTPFTYTNSVKPVCLNFNYQLDKTQMAPGNYGKVAGWGLTGDNAKESPVLKVVEMPVVSIEECIAETEPIFINFITSDKICAGYQNGTAVCKGDSGGGLTFPQRTGHMTRHFLRGVVSSAPRNQNLCNTLSWATFTHVFKHEHFIKETIQASVQSSASAITAH